MESASSKIRRRLVTYDRELQRVWIGNQRIHHGFTGALLAAAGAALMLHDRKDLPLWFQLGPGDQP